MHAYNAGQTRALLKKYMHLIGITDKDACLMGAINIQSWEVTRYL